MAIIGLDVGGTHTDAVLIENGRIIALAKQPTNRENLTGSLMDALYELLNSCDATSVRRIQLSTTLSTNLIAEGKLDPVGVVIQSGPGLNPEFLTCGTQTCFLSGAVDHRGYETSLFRAEDASAAARSFHQAGIHVVAIVSKFSPRNPDVEKRIATHFTGGFATVTLGHEVSGALNFPRRVFGTWLNAAVSRRFRDFGTAIRNALTTLKVTAPVFMLKADGGTMSLDAAIKAPLQTIQSGPAASIVGAISVFPELEAGGEDAVLLDIGGTTTDIAFLAGGIPLFFPRGVVVAGRLTPVRGLWSRSIPLGGDGRVTVRDDGRLAIGPMRDGPAEAFGGPSPTPTDAMITLGLARCGNSDLARKAIRRIATRLDIDVSEAARRILIVFADMAKNEVDKALAEVNNRPIFTIQELLIDRTLRPRRLSLIGGPATALAPVLADSFGLPMTNSPLSPEILGAANAIGAALSSPTAEVTLTADTVEGHLSVPELSLREPVEAAFTLESARARAVELLGRRAESLGICEAENTAELLARRAEIIEESQFNLVEGFSTRGRRFRVKAHLKPTRLESLVKS
ncbi:MAG: hydantoinase/oxoprolinase family protein [Candidatus Ozemobacteraceae bacterium]